METKKTRLNQLYQIARAHGLAHSKGDFASLIGVESSSLSHALKDDGKIKIDNVINKAEHALMKAGIDYGTVTGQIRDGSDTASGDESVQNISGNNNQIGIPPKKFESEKDWFALVAEKDKQIDRLLTIIETITNTSK